jgi:hypothetical protein
VRVKKDGPSPPWIDLGFQGANASKTLPGIELPVEGSIPSLGRRKSESRVANRAEPQSKQTKILGNARTPGFTRCLGPLKWIMISAVNSALFWEEHDLQLTVPSNHSSDAAGGIVCATLRLLVINPPPDIR